MGDYVVRGIAADGQIRAFACNVTESVEEARMRHDSTPVATAALGRTMAAAAMMSCDLDTKDESITISISGNGPIGKVIAIGDGGGRLRGYIQNPKVDLPLKSKGHLDVAGALGIGVMNVIKDLGMKEPYIGSTHLVTSEIGEDLAYYFAESEQIPSAVAVSVLMSPEKTVWTAGGYLIQLMPGATEEVAAILEERVKNFPQLSHYLAEGHTPEEVLAILLENMDFKNNGRVEFHYECDCSRSRVERALVTMGKKEIEAMVEAGEPIETTCNFCGQKYHFSTDELKLLLERIEKAEKEAKEAPQNEDSSTEKQLEENA